MSAKACAALLGWMCALPVLAEDTGNWLSRLQDAQQHRSFSGAYIHQWGADLDSSQIWQRAEGGERLQRLLRQDGTIQEQARKNGHVLCGKEASFESPLLPHSSGALTDFYLPQVLGRERVAGRAGQLVQLKPRDAHRYAWRLVVDDESGLPLRRELLGAHGEPLERMQFVALQLGAPMPAAVQASEHCAAVAEVDAVEAAALWQPGWLPEGFELFSVRRDVSPVSGQPVLVQLYGDGLVYLSVFVEPVQAGATNNAHSQSGPTAIASRRRSTSAGDVMVTVLGEVPPATVERVLIALRAPGDPS